MGAKLTNKYNFPQTIVDAVKIDNHRVAGNVSCSQLIDGPQVRILKRMHDYSEDVSEKLYALMGTALHGILERANMPEVRKRAFILTAETIMQEAEKMEKDNVEKATQLKAAANYIFKLVPVFFPELNSRYLFEKTMQLNFGDMDLYGTFDLYDKETGILYDYKFCSVYAWIFPESRKKWKQQMSVYASLLVKEGYPVNGLRIMAFFRDWSDSGKLRNKDYPESQLMEIFIELRPMEEIDAFIAKRINIHREAEHGNVAECTGGDRWASSDQFAVLLTGGKKALRLFDNKDLAHSFISETQHKYAKNLWLQVRPGKSVRCERFCPVSSVCPQYKRELEKLVELEKTK